jgi:hypothetical protein
MMLRLRKRSRRVSMTRYRGYRGTDAAEAGRADAGHGVHCVTREENRSGRWY